MDVRFLQIEPTTRCNFTCGFCCGRYMEQSDLDFGRFEQALAALPGVRHVELQGEGESLMHPRFLDMVALLRGRGVKVSLISNGSLLSEETCARLLDLGLEKVSVSLESADPATFRGIRGGRLDKVVRGIETLKRLRDERGRDRPVLGFSITVLKQTQDHLQDILALYHRLGLDGGVTLQPLQRMEPYVRNYRPDLQEQLLSNEEVDDLWVRFRADRALVRIQKGRRPVQSFFDEMMDGWRAGSRRCPWLDAGLYVNNQGHATACCMVKDVERHGFGRIGDDPPERILEGRRRMQAQLAAGEVPAACSGCELARFAVMKRHQLVAFGLRGMWRRLVRPRRPPPAPPPPRSLPVVAP